VAKAKICVAAWRRPQTGGGGGGENVTCYRREEYCQSARRNGWRQQLKYQRGLT